MKVDNNGSIAIEISASSKSAAENIGQLSNSLKELKASVSGSTRGMTALSKRLSELAKSANSFSASSKKLNSISKLFESMGKLGQVKIPKSLAENLGSIANSVKDVSSETISNLDKMTASLQRLSGVDLKGFKEVASQSYVSDIQAKVASATKGNGTFAGEDAVKYEKELRKIDKAIERTINNIESLKKSMSIEQSADGGGDTSKIESYNAAIAEQTTLLERLIEQRKRLTENGNETSKFSEFFSNLKTGFVDLVKYSASASWSVLKFGTRIASIPFKKAIKNTSAFVGKISGLGAAFKRIMFYRAIRLAIKEIADAFREGANNLYYYSQGVGGQFAKSMDAAATSLLYFKNSIGATVAPLVNALAPVLDMLVDKVVAVINAINQLIAKLTGAAYWTKAIKYPKAYGDAVAGAGKKAKEALRYLAPFDELNVLPSNNAGSGGVGAADDYSSMFEEVSDFNSKITDFAESIKNAVKNGEWEDVGKMLGSKVNQAVNSVNWKGIGAKVGYYINAWFTSKYWTLKSVNFTNIGKSIAEFLNNALSGINFETIGRGFVRGFTWVADLVIGAVTNTDWKSVGKALGDYLKGAFDEASEWLRSYDWSKIGSDLWGYFSDLIAGIDFTSIAKSFFAFLGNAFGASVKAIGAIFDGIMQDVSDYFKEKTKEAGGNAWEGFKLGIKDAVVGVYTWVKTNMVDPFVNAVKSILGIHSPSTVFADIGRNVIQGLWNGITEKWSKLTTWFQQKWNNLVSWWRGLSLGPFHVTLPHLRVDWEPVGANNVLAKLFGFTAIPHLGVDWYAKGGVFDKASLIGVGEAGKEAVVPLERNTEWIGKVAAEMRSQMERGNNQTAFGGSMADDLEDANGIVVNAIMAGVAQIVDAMQRNGNSENGNVDWNSFVRKVTQTQNRQARAMNV